MGVSLQIYRVRIGTFIPSVRVKTNMEQPGTILNVFKWTYKLGTCLAMVCLLAISISILLSQENIQLWTGIAQAPPTTACDPSRGPPGLSWIICTAIQWICHSSVPAGSSNFVYQPQTNIIQHPFKLLQVQPPSPWTSSACTPAATKSQNNIHLNPTYLHMRQPPS